MTRLIEAPTRLAAWLEGATSLMRTGRELNVILTISDPGSDGSAAAPAHKLIDEFFRAEGAYTLHTVAETIFPGWEYSRRGLRGVYETYAVEEYPLVKKNWGTYAYRLVRRATATGQYVNPLDALIRKMRDEAGKVGKGAFTSCYELGIAEGPYDVPLYNTVDDEGRRRGGPCLSHLSFKLYEGSVHLTAVYRSHDYRYKVLGNLLGLARLQACVATEVGVPLGSLVVHSTYAYVEAGKGKRPFKVLLNGVAQLIRTGV